MEEKIRLIMSLGFAPDYAEDLATSRTVAQIRKWVAAAKDKNDPVRYFKVAHRANDPVIDKAQVRADAEAALADTENTDLAERRRRRDRVYLALTLPDHPWQEDTHEAREALLREFGFHPLAANQLAARRSLAEVIQWIDASETEAHPWAFVRQQLVWGSLEPAWPTDSEQTPGELDLLKQWDVPRRTMRLPDGRVVVHRPCPEGWEKYTVRLRDLLGRQPWSDYSDAGGQEMAIPFGLRGAAIGDILPGIVNPAEAAKARVSAILDRQARGSEVARSIERLKREELMDNPFGPGDQ